MAEEMVRLSHAGTWTLTRLPEGRKAIPCKWVFATKYNHLGELVRYKARLVAKGYTQIPGIDFAETFLPSMSMNALHTILAIGSIMDLEIHQVDIKSTYLNRKLEEEIYMEQPPCYPIT